MALKWKSYLDDSLKFMSSSWFSTTTYVVDIRGAGSVFHYFLFLSVFDIFDLNVVENFLLEPKEL